MVGFTDVSQMARQQSTDCEDGQGRLGSTMLEVLVMEGCTSRWGGDVCGKGCPA